MLPNQKRHTDRPNWRNFCHFWHLPPAISTSRRLAPQFQFIVIPDHTSEYRSNGHGTTMMGADLSFMQSSSLMARQIPGRAAARPGAKKTIVGSGEEQRGIESGIGDVVALAVWQASPGASSSSVHTANGNSAGSHRRTAEAPQATGNLPAPSQRCSLHCA